MDGEYVIVENDVFYETRKQKEQREREEEKRAFDHVAHGFDSYDDAYDRYCLSREYAPYEVTETFEEWCEYHRERVLRQKAYWEQKKIEEFEEGVRQRGLEIVKWERERKSVRGMKACKTGHGVMRLVKKIARVFVR